MGVWVMNLIDNRERDVNTPEKFRLCKNIGMLAIGWGKEKTLEFYTAGELKAYKAAVKGLLSIKPDDLVWVRDTANKEYYICKVYGALESASKDLQLKDIVQYRKAKWHGPVSQNELPAPLTVRRLISRSTIRRVLKPDVIRAAQDFFNSTLVHKRIVLEATE